jgi:hypothetical protein
MKNIFLFLLLAITMISCTPSQVPDDGDILAEEQYRMVTGTKDLVDPVHGKRIGFFYGAIDGVTGSKANGVAYMHVFEDGTTQGSVNLNIQQAEQGTRYIVNFSTPSNVLYEAGELSSILNDVRHSMSFDATEDLSAYTSVNIVLESGGVRKVVGHGTLKQPPAGTW